MDIKIVKQLGELAKKLDLSVIEICEGDSKIRVERKVSAEVSNLQVVPPIKSSTIEASICAEKPLVGAHGEIDFNDYKAIKSPMIGVFYSTPTPEAKPFVSIGETVKKGQILCIIEAMKVMNEITSEFDGEIIDICAKNSDIVEYGQTLFKIY